MLLEKLIYAPFLEWRLAQEPGHVAQLNYLRSELNVSDHKPVMSTFLVTIKDVILSRREQVYKAVMKLLVAFENASLPMVSLDRINLDFGKIRYDQRVTLPITITNTGQVVAQFRMVPKLDEVSAVLRFLLMAWIFLKYDMWRIDFTLFVI